MAAIPYRISYKLKKTTSIFPPTIVLTVRAGFRCQTGPSKVDRFKFRTLIDQILIFFLKFVTQKSDFSSNFFKIRFFFGQITIFEHIPISDNGLNLTGFWSKFLTECGCVTNFRYLTKCDFLSKFRVLRKHFDEFVTTNSTFFQTFVKISQTNLYNKKHEKI